LEHATAVAIEQRSDEAFADAEPLGLRVNP
jgi:hypothetical protein